MNFMDYIRFSTNIVKNQFFSQNIVKISKKPAKNQHSPNIEKLSAYYYSIIDIFSANIARLNRNKFSNINIAGGGTLGLAKNHKFRKQQ